MPLPAGTGLDRRTFVARTFGLALSVYGLSKLGLFEEGIARAASGPAQPVLVSVFLPGGTDALSVLYPALDPAGSNDNPLQGLSLDYQLQPSLASLKVPVASLAAPDEYTFWAPGVWGEVESRMLETLGPLGARRSDPFLNQAAKATAQSDRLRKQLAPLASDDRFGTPVPYPEDDSGFPRQLAGLAAMLAANLPLRCVALSAPGEYDTHADQPQALADGLDITARTLLAFQRDLEARGLADRVLTLVWSEFGRRGEENGSDGTDHGAAGTAFLVGTRAKGQLVGEFPGLSNLDGDGNLKPTSDFRGVYCSLLEQWLGADASAVIPRASAFS